jgi:hypothetical protein
MEVIAGLTHRGVITPDKAIAKCVLAYIERAKNTTSFSSETFRGSSTPPSSTLSSQNVAQRNRYLGENPADRTISLRAD